MNNPTFDIQGRWSFALLLMLTAVSLGCGGMTQAPVDVSGNISIEGKPLNQGSVIFTDKKGERAYGEIQPDGSFLVPQIVPGTFRVSVSVPQRRRGRGENADPARGARPMPVPVPSRYASVDSSGLEFEIDAKKPDVTIQLKR
ncbi:hypothetical protein Pan97_25330 [Bremerella volcania]|uniref:Carboxypeptidase regulatory-like domain-containing protein n=1 Tax=Bremerella volcania TaxID=2527984 RepID=A0A518C8G3_9BACT|nr:hypothetical protein [Bremerella volcania]QDU75500.1 hypothetical protein Pan97_25330 [Bremerella volcania]